MYHVAIMKKQLGFLEKIVSGEKSIESRWLMKRSAPWGKVAVGDTIYFKNSGSPVTVSARVKNILSFSHLTPMRVKEILDMHWHDLGIEVGDMSRFYTSVKDKKYCVLIFLDKPKRVVPFHINKTGFGAMSAWLCMKNINSIKVSE